MQALNRFCPLECCYRTGEPLAEESVILIENPASGANLPDSAQDSQALEQRPPYSGAAFFDGELGQRPKRDSPRSAQDLCALHKDRGSSLSDYAL